MILGPGVISIAVHKRKKNLVLLSLLQLSSLEESMTRHDFHFWSNGPLFFGIKMYSLIFFQISSSGKDKIYIKMKTLQYTHI